MSLAHGYAIERVDEGGAAVVVLSGEIDVAAAPELHEVLLVEVGSSRRTIVDLARVTFLDSSGISVLVTALRRAREDDEDVVLCAPSAGVARVLELAGLAEVFRIFPDRDGALAAEPGPPSTPDRDAHDRSSPTDGH